MRSGNEADNAALVERLEHIERLLADAVALARGSKLTKRPPEHKARPAPRQRAVGNIDYSTNIRAFVRRHSAGMSGQKKFTLLVAYLSKGDSSRRISLDEIQKQWKSHDLKGIAWHEV